MAQRTWWPARARLLNEQPSIRPDARSGRDTPEELIAFYPRIAFNFTFRTASFGLIDAPSNQR